MTENRLWGLNMILWFQVDLLMTQNGLSAEGGAAGNSFVFWSALG